MKIKWILGTFLRKYCVYQFAILVDFSPSNALSYPEIALIALLLAWHLI
jgi:hypothetical protein